MGLPSLATDLAVRRSTGRAVYADFPYSLVSGDQLLDALAELTAIRPHAGWRSCGSRGEAEARDWVASRLAELSFLNGAGLEVEIDEFRTIAGMEMWQTRLELLIGGEPVEVPADAPTGHPYRIWIARDFDSDGNLTDLERDPVVASAAPVVVRTVEDLDALVPTAVAGRVVVLDFALVDWVLVPGSEAFGRINTITGMGPAGLLAVTSGSNEIGESHGSFAGDSSVLNYAQVDPRIPILFTRLEDVVAAGVDGWAGLQTADAIRLTWDADIVTPGASANVVARIPGASSDHAVILSAHLDSPNSPGALDNGSGSVALVEVARVLNQARITPPTDVYLVWFGCHERGLFGSPHFAATHQEVLDSALAIVELDAMARPLDGFEEAINLESRSYMEFGDARIPLPEYLRDRVEPLDIEVEVWDFPGLLSDITGFVGFDVPNALLDNLKFPEMNDSSLHYAAHWHDPYDTVELAADVVDVFEDLTRVLLATVLEVGADAPDLRVTPEPTYRAVVVGSHTEAEAMGPFALTEFGMTLAWAGFDVDQVPYGERLTAEHLEGADLVIVLPVLDYPNEYGDVNLYDEEWRGTEAAVVEDYVNTRGGWLVLANSGHRLWFSNATYEPNEDWGALYTLSHRFGVVFNNGPTEGTTARTTSGHNLMAGVETLWLAEDNFVPFVLPFNATVLARVDDWPVAAVFNCGAGGVIVLGDVGILGDSLADGDNRQFWRNLAEWAKAPP
jgi:hypothetical protein